MKLLAITIAFLFAGIQPGSFAPAKSIYDFNVESLDGGTIDFSKSLHSIMLAFQPDQIRR